MRIEVGTLERLDALAALFDAYRVFYKRPSDLSGARRYMEARLSHHDAHVFCAVDDSDTAVGFTLLYPCFTSVAMARLCILNDLFVAPQARRQGVGRMLLEAARQHAINTGAIRLVLSTQKTNKTAQALYESAGWVREEEFFQYQLAVTG